ncbi:MAG TPA: hypothetical protein PKC45_16545 [Gemmatales bacterium]|nr:hypothetical protein [Gemmatales bacterium]
MKFYGSLVLGLLLLGSAGLQGRLVLAEGEWDWLILLQLGVFAFGALAFLLFAYQNRPRRSAG